MQRNNRSNSSNLTYNKPMQKPYSLILLSFFAVACCLPATTAQATPPESITIRLSFDPPTLDWNLGDVPIHVINNVVEGLYAIDARGALVPCEAESLPRNVGPGRFRA